MDKNNRESSLDRLIKIYKNVKKEVVDLGDYLTRG